MLCPSLRGLRSLPKGIANPKTELGIFGTSQRSMSTTSKVALVTGGSRGIGKAISELLLQENYRVAVVSRSDLCKKTADALSTQIGRPGAAVGFEMDVGSPESIKSVFKQIEDTIGPVDVVVNNAGIAKDGLLIKLKEQDLQDTIATNLIGPILLSKEVITSMLRRKATGNIVMIGSIVGQEGNPGQVSYAATKAGLIGVTKTLAMEYGSRGIRTNLVSPGFVRTDMTASLKLSPTTIEVSPQDVAKAVLFILQSPSVNGQTITMDSLKSNTL